MRRVVILVGVAAMCVCLSVIYMTLRVAAGASVTFKPFTATVHETKFYPNGGAAREETYTVAFRPDGSNVTDYHRRLSTGQTTEVKLIEDVIGGRRVAVDYATESTSTYPLPSNYSAIMAKQATACGNSSSSREPAILGYQVVLIHDGHKFGNGARNVRDLWEAPALNCFALRSVAFATKQPGEKAPHNEAEAIEIVLGEPNSALFSIPQNFVERSPSERHAEFEQRFGLPAATPPNADQVYNSSRDKLK